MADGSLGEWLRIGWGRAAAVGALCVLLVGMALGARWRFSNERPAPSASLLVGRPQQDRQLFDYAGILTHYEEGAERFLRRMSERLEIEAVIVTLATLPETTYLEQLAVDLVHRWRIGSQHDGRGLLVLLVEQDKQVKLEVTYALEDIFTDAFTARVQDLQLRPYYLANDIGTGLAAVMEQLEQRAELERRSDYAPKLVLEREAQLSGGAGSVRNLDRYENSRPSTAELIQEPRSGARSPEEAWQVMLTKWAGHGRDIDVDVYTEIAKLEMGSPDDADPRTRRSVEHWKNANYQVLQDGEHAVIWFGNLKGWNNAPFLFCRTDGGWKFDIVHQRRLVVMGASPDWMIEQGDYPYLDLLDDAPKSTGKDLPLTKEDRYSCRNDAALGRQIRELQRTLERSPDDVSVLTALTRLNVITGRRPAHVQPLLRRLERLAPDQADVYKYSAFYDVNTFFQYETALKKMTAYAKLRPEDAFGYSFLGFLQYRLKDYESSIESLEKAIEIESDNAYARSLLARTHAQLAREP